MSEDGILVNLTKIKVIQEWPIPTNVSKVRSFMGLVRYYKKYIKVFSRICYAFTFLFFVSKHGTTLYSQY